MESSIEDQAITEVCQSRYHRTFHLPASAARNRQAPFRVTYSDFGRPAASTPDEEASLPTVFFCGGLMAGRWMLTASDEIARKKGVRIICIDRPGMGGTHAVPPDQRLAVWLEIVPALLNHLSIRHVALASHSGGVIYALNLLLTRRDLLHPRRPYVAFFAPWVHQSHTDATTLAVTDFLPRSWIASLHDVAQFVSKYVAPSVGFSSGILSKFLPSDSKPVTDPSTPADDPSDKKLVQAKDSLIMKYVFAEEISGVSEDAILFLRRTGTSHPWGSWGDFDTGIPLLVAQEVSRGPRKSDEAVLKVETWYSESDRMSGTTGWKWFDSCWANASEDGARAVDFDSRISSGTNHDNVLDRKYGVLETWLDTVAISFSQQDKVSKFI